MVVYEYIIENVNFKIKICICFVICVKKMWFIVLVYIIVKGD